MMVALVEKGRKMYVDGQMFEYVAPLYAGTFFCNDTEWGVGGAGAGAEYVAI